MDATGVLIMAKKKPKKRTVQDFRKGIRKNQPTVPASIDNLIDKFMKNDKPAYDKRYARK